MCHTEDYFLGSVVPSPLNQLIQGGNQTLTPFQSEALGTRILCVQMLFYPFRRS